MVRFPIATSFEEEIVPAYIITEVRLLVARLRFILPEVIFKVPTVNLEFKNGVKLDPPPKVNALLEISFSTFTELLKMFIATPLLVRLLDIVIILGVLMVSEPTFNSLFAKSIEVKPDPDKSRLGVALDVIEPVKVKFPTMVRVFPVKLFQFAVLLDINDRLDIVEVSKYIGVPAPVVVTYTFGLLVVPRSAVMYPDPLPPRYTKEAVCTVSNVRVLGAVALPVTYIAVNGGVKLRLVPLFIYKLLIPV